MTKPAAVVRNGTAIEVTSETGVRLLRGVELSQQIGRFGWGELVSAALDQTDPSVLHIELGDRVEVFRLRVAQGASLVVRNATLMSCDGDPSDPLEVINGGAVIIGGGKFLWRGRSDEIESSGIDVSRADVFDAGGALVSPGLIDCHTHLVFAGSRDAEFALRARGASYQEIASAGGGIASTRAATLALEGAEHVALASKRLDAALAGGTTTIEAKSGYALTVKGELEVLEAALALDSLHPVDVMPTLLGAHVVPPEMKETRARYVSEVALEMIPKVRAAKLASSVDVYCDEGAFTLEETREILTAARSAGLDVRAHVGQFADLGGPQLLGELGALSADHLEEISDEGIASLAVNGVTAVMLPSACVQLRQAPPPVEKLRKAGVRMAVATDMNPGSSFCESLEVPMWLASTHYGMTVEETWLGVTREAARALGRHDIGTITVGAQADLVIWDCERPSEVPYRIGKRQVAHVIKAGRPI